MKRGGCYETRGSNRIVSGRRSDLFYGISSPQGGGKITLETKLRYRQADQEVAEALLGAVPEDINLKEIYGLTKVPPLPVVDMVVKKVSFSSKK